MRRALLIPVLAGLVGVACMLFIVPTASADRPDDLQLVAHRGHRSYLHHYRYGHQFHHGPVYVPHCGYPRIIVPVPGHPPVYHYRHWYYSYPHSGLYYHGNNFGFSLHF